MSVFIIEKLTKIFKVDRTENVVLNDINLVLPDHGLVSIIGKSGSGKSTFLNILMGIEKPTKGKVYFNGEDISKLNDKKFSSYHLNGVSLVFQHYNLFNDLSAFDNVVLPLKIKNISYKERTQIVNKLFTKFKLDKIKNQKTSKLSGGEKQRVAILRALATSPKAILCDEPTGALDSKNSVEIMGILKEISQNTLVVIVSHNKDLVYRFSDQILVLKNGKIVENVSSIKDNFTSKFKMKKHGYNAGWYKRFLGINLRKNLKKNILSILSCSFSFAAMFIAVGFSIGSKSSQNEALRRSLSIGYATVSKSEFVDIEGSPLLFQKTTRPDVNLVDEYFENFSSIRCEENFSYLISNFPTCTFNDKRFTNFQMIPAYDLTLEKYGLDLLSSGVRGSNDFEEVLVNEEFAELLGKTALNSEIILSNSATVNYSTGDENNPFIKDTLILNKKVKIKGILHEFSFLNSPKIYFSYKGAKSFLKSSLMENVSYFLGKNYSFYDYIINCKPDDPATSYSSYIFLDDLSELDMFFDKVEKSKASSLEITSTVFDIKETYTTFINSFSTTLYVFVIIAFAGINFILGMISLSTFIENKKNTAIMTCLGSRNKSIYSLYLSENYIVVLFSFVVSIFLAKYLQSILNPILANKFSLSNLIEIPFFEFLSIPFGLVLLIFFIAIIFATVFTLTPMLFYRHTSLADELRDE